MKLPALPAALVVLLALTSAALAQDTTVALPDTLVGFVIQIAFLVVSGVIAVFLPILLTKLATKFNLQIEQAKRDALQVTLTNAAGGLLQQLGERAKTVKIDVRDPAMKAAIDRVLAGAPDAVKWAGLTEAEIAKRILEKLPQIEASSGPAPMSTPTN